MTILRSNPRLSVPMRTAPRPQRRDDRKQVVRVRLVGALEIATKALPLITVGALVMGVSIDTTVFFHWGLDFLQIAQPADILSSALQVIILGLSNFQGLATGLLIGYAASGLSDRLALVLKVAMAAICLAALTVCALIWSHKVGWDRESVVWLKRVGALLLGTTAGVLINARSSLLAWLSILGAVSVCFAVGVGSAFSIAIVGFPQSTLVATGERLPKDCLGHVLWVGSQSVVVNCREGPSAYVTERQNLVLRVYDSFYETPPETPAPPANSTP